MLPPTCVAVMRLTMQCEVIAARAVSLISSAVLICPEVHRGNAGKQHIQGHIFGLGLLES